MAKAVLLSSGGGGVTSDDVTAKKTDIPKGLTTLTSDSNDEIVEGSLELTGDATNDKVLEESTYYNTDLYTKQTGTMPNKTGWNSKNINAGSTVTIPKGYHDGSQTVTAKTLAAQTAVDSGKTAVGAAQMLTGYQGWVNGTKVSGTMANKGAVTATLNCGGSYNIPAGYHNGAGKVTANSLSSQTVGNATAARMLSGYVAYVNGAKITGSIASLAGGTYRASSSQQTINCAGKYMTSNIVINASNVNSILSFNFASRNYSTANFKWQNPTKGPYLGIVIRGKNGSYPANVNDGTLIYQGYGTNATPSGTSYSGFVNCGTGNWYFRAFSYFNLNNAPVYSSSSYNVSAQFTCYKCSNEFDCTNCGDEYDITECDGNCTGNDVCSESYNCGTVGPGMTDCYDCSESWECHECNNRVVVDTGCDDCYECSQCSNRPSSCIANS